METKGRKLPSNGIIWKYLEIYWEEDKADCTDNSGGKLADTDRETR